MAGFNYLLNYLNEEGFKVEEEEQHFSFKYQGSLFVAFKNDSIFLQIVLICNVKGVDANKLLEVCNEMNRDKFVCKFIVMDDKVWCSYEFIPSEHTPGDEFKAALTFLDKGSDELFERLRQL